MCCTPNEWNSRIFNFSWTELAYCLGKIRTLKWLLAFVAKSVLSFVNFFSIVLFSLECHVSLINTQINVSIFFSDFLFSFTISSFCPLIEKNYSLDGAATKCVVTLRRKWLLTRWSHLSILSQRFLFYFTGFFFIFSLKCLFWFP
jgi:hypothetical protein